MNNAFNVQERFSPKDIQFKTVKNDVFFFRQQNSIFRQFRPFFAKLGLFFAKWGLFFAKWGLFFPTFFDHVRILY